MAVTTGPSLTPDTPGVTINGKHLRLAFDEIQIQPMPGEMVLSYFYRGKLMATERAPWRAGMVAIKPDITGEVHGYLK